MKLLIVEDEVDSQQVMSSLLDIIHISADAAGSAEAGLAQLESHDYDAVIIDLALPGMDGFGLLNQIRSSAELKNLPCVAVTAFHSSEVKKQALDAGFDGYFAKPLNTRNFTHDLMEVLNQS